MRSPEPCEGTTRHLTFSAIPLGALVKVDGVDTAVKTNRAMGNKSAQKVLAQSH